MLQDAVDRNVPATSMAHSTDRSRGVEAWPHAARIVDTVGRRLQAQYGKEPIPSGVIMREVERAGGPKKGSALPSDYCYNKINAAPLAFEWRVFIEVDRGLYKYVGPGYSYTGAVRWKPADGPERNVGEWVNGVCTLHFDPRDHTRGERARLAAGRDRRAADRGVEA